MEKQIIAVLIMAAGLLGIGAFWSIWATIPEYLRDIARELKRANDIAERKM